VSLLLDTHALIWWATDDSALSSRARDRIARSEDVLVSAASAWEMAIKVSLGRFPAALDLVTNFEDSLRSRGLEVSQFQVRTASAQDFFPGPHKDPFDRMLIAQAQAENLAIVSNEQIFDRYGVRRIW
jgi:PIN domain nuclease of toxin-antitoxin system